MTRMNSRNAHLRVAPFSRHFRAIYGSGRSKLCRFALSTRGRQSYEHLVSLLNFFSEGERPCYHHHASRCRYRGGETGGPLKAKLMEQIQGCAQETVRKFKFNQ